MNIGNRVRQAIKEHPDYRLMFFTVAVFLVLIVALSIMSPAFLNPTNLKNILVQGSIYVILGVGMTLVLTTGGIDISIGSIVGLSTCFIGSVMKLHGFPFEIGILAGLLVGTICGVFNGFCIVYLKVPAIITTLGSWTMFRGLANWYLGGTIYYDFAPGFVSIARGNILGVPVPIVLAFIVMLAGYYFLSRTRTGRNIVALGGNEEAARLAGINVNRTRFLVYAIMGFLAGFAAVVVTSRLNSASSVIGSGMELHTIAAVVVGGTSLFGGRGLMLGTLLGVYILGILENGLLLGGISFFGQRVTLGLIFILVVAARTFRQKEGEIAA